MSYGTPSVACRLSITKYCNIKQNSSIAWLEYATVDGAGIEKTLEDFRDCYAVGECRISPPAP